MQGCMSAFGGMEPVQLCEGLARLKSEHAPLLEKLDGLYKLTQDIDLETDVNENFIKLTTEVKVFISELEPHSKREEGVLFRMMEAYLGVGMGPIAVMEYEHDQAKTLIATFLNETASNTNLSIMEKRKYAGLIRNAYFTLTEHFAKEENVLFPMAERMLSIEEKDELLARIKEI